MARSKLQPTSTDENRQEGAMVKFHDPRGETAIPIEPYQLSYFIENEGEGTTLGLLANGFPDSENFLDKLAGALKSRYPKLEIRTWNKGNASIPAPQEILDEIKAHCQIAIAAYGH